MWPEDARDTVSIAEVEALGVASRNLSGECGLSLSLVSAFSFERLGGPPASRSGGTELSGGMWVRQRGYVGVVRGVVADSRVRRGVATHTLRLPRRLSRTAHRAESLGRTLAPKPRGALSSRRLGTKGYARRETGR